jgi:hypothetical protein
MKEFLDPRNALSLTADWAGSFEEFTTAFYPLEDDSEGVSLRTSSWAADLCDLITSMPRPHK